MKRVRYTKFTGDLASEIDLEDLLKSLSDYLLDSGYYDPFTRFQDLDHTLDDLREALRRVLEQGDFLGESMRQKIQQLSTEGNLDELIEKLMERMERENYISSPAQPDATRMSDVNGQVGQPQEPARLD